MFWIIHLSLRHLYRSAICLKKRQFNMFISQTVGGLKIINYYLNRNESGFNANFKKPLRRIAYRPMMATWLQCVLYSRHFDPDTTIVVYKTGLYVTKRTRLAGKYYMWLAWIIKKIGTCCFWLMSFIIEFMERALVFFDFWMLKKNKISHIV